MHVLVRELLALIPPEGSPWPRRARRRWVAAMSAVLDVVYEDEAEPWASIDLRPGSAEAATGRGRHARPDSP